MNEYYETLLAQLPHGVSLGKESNGTPFISLEIFNHKKGFSGETYLEVIKKMLDYCKNKNIK